MGRKKERNLCLSMNFTESLQQQQLTIQVNKVCVMSFSDQKKFCLACFAFAGSALQHTPGHFQNLFCTADHNSLFIY